MIGCSEFYIWGAVSARVLTYEELPPVQLTIL
jgi:hypothetical protein